MKLLEMHLKGFGRLVDRKFAFAPGLNLVYGPNEVGKSTLQRAIVALLFGFFDEGNITQKRRELLDALKPWDSAAPYAGSLSYALDDGKQFRVTRQFAPQFSTSLTRLPRTDVTGQYKDLSQGRLLFAESQLGLSRLVFENVCSVRQAELVALESTSADTIAATVARLTAAGSSDTNVDQALNELERALQTDVGTLRAYTRPLAVSLKALREAESERQRVFAAREDLVSQIEACRQAEIALTRSTAEVQRISLLRSLAEREALQRQVQGVEEAAQDARRCSAELAQYGDWATFPVILRDDILVAQDQWQRLAEEYPRVEAQALVAEEALRQARADVAQTELRLAALADVPPMSDEQIHDIESRAHEWQRAAEARARAEEARRAAADRLLVAERALNALLPGLEPLQTLGPTGLARLQQQVESGRARLRAAEQRVAAAQAEWLKTGMSEAQFNELQETAAAIRSGGAPTPATRRGCNPFRAARPAPEQPPTQLVLHDQLGAIQRELRQAQADLAAARETTASDEAVARQRLGLAAEDRLDSATFDSLSVRLDDWLQAKVGVEQLRRSAEQAAEQLTTARAGEQGTIDRLFAGLAQVGVTSSDPDTGWKMFLQQCERRRQREQQAASLERSRLRMDALGRDAEERRQLETARQAAETRLLGLLCQAHIECSVENLADGLQRFQTGVQQHAQWSAAQARYEEAQRRHAALMEARERSGTLARLQQLEVSQARTLADHPDWIDIRPDRSEAEYAAREKNAAQLEAEARERLRRLKADVEGATNQLRHPAAVEEDLAALQLETRRLEQYGEALKLAIGELGEAKREYQQQFAPRLEQVMTEGLSVISDRRYTRVSVDPSSLAVSLHAPERNGLVNARLLSSGTRDMVYLLLRIAVAQLMSRSSEALPLMLDDPLTQLDRNRQQRALEYLRSLATQTQLFLFTKDEWTREWFGRTYSANDGHALHELT